MEGWRKYLKETYDPETGKEVLWVPPGHAYLRAPNLLPGVEVRALELPPVGEFDIGELERVQYQPGGSGDRIEFIDDSTQLDSESINAPWQPETPEPATVPGTLVPQEDQAELEAILGAVHGDTPEPEIEPPPTYEKEVEELPETPEPSTDYFKNYDRSKPEVDKRIDRWESGTARHAKRLEKYDQHFDKWGKAFGLDPDFLRGLARVESGGNPDAVSHAGAVGLMQILSTEAIDKYNANVLRKGKPKRVRPPGHPLSFEKAIRKAPPPGYEADYERLSKSPFDPESSIYAAAKKLAEKKEYAAKRMARVNEDRVRRGLAPYNVTPSNIEDYALITYHRGNRGGFGDIILPRIEASGSPDVDKWVNPSTGMPDIETKRSGASYATKARAGQSWYRKNRSKTTLQEMIYKGIMNVLREHGA